MQNAWLASAHPDLLQMAAVESRKVVPPDCLEKSYRLGDDSGSSGFKLPVSAGVATVQITQCSTTVPLGLRVTAVQRLRTSFSPQTGTTL